jgi:hypothetical protein
MSRQIDSKDVGYDVNSTTIWQDYLSFIKQSEVCFVSHGLKREFFDLRCSRKRRLRTEEIHSCALRDVSHQRERERGKRRTAETVLRAEFSAQVKTERDREAKVALQRRTYQRAIETPMYGIEALWKEYEAFEASIHKAAVLPPAAESFFFSS